MFDVLSFASDDPHREFLRSTPESLKEQCLHSAALWVLRRRANLPYRAPQRLPVTARAG